MSNKSSNSSQVLSLPKGGGALQGIGEKFSPDLHTGTGNFTVPIALPPGRNGFQPQLSLVYSTGNGNGPFGLGWSLSIPGVSRQISEGVPRYDDVDDVFVLSGAEDLVPVPGAPPGVTRYRPRTEGLFARIDHRRDSSNDYWEVRSKDGLVSYYGTPGSTGLDPALVADPLDRTRAFAWKLSQTIDPFGNRIEYEYLRDSGREGPHDWDQLYLRRIRYADYEENGETRFVVSVSLEYEDRPDPFSVYRSGLEIRTRKRCTRIEVRTHADEERLVRVYHLTYSDQLLGPEQLLPPNAVSLLRQFKAVGHDGDRTEELPPLEFGYTRFEPEHRDFFPVQGAELPAVSLANPDLDLVDLFGNGLPDLLEMNGTVRYWRNLGRGAFDLPREMRAAPAGVRLSDPGVQLIDANGDGRTDLLVSTEALTGYFPLTFAGGWDRRSFQRHQRAPSFDLEDPEVRLVDLDGDGVTDAIRSGSRLECFFNDPREGWNGTRWVERRALEEFPDINFSDSHVQWADMTGDGLQDIVLVYDGNVEYWPNLGHGNWGKRVSMRNSPRLPYGYDPKRILIGDVDGDGAADLLYVDHCKVMLWINQSGNSWSEPIEIQGTPPVSDMAAVRLADLLGAGISGVLWTADASGLAREHMFFLDLTGGIKPYLLNEMNNHMGAVTRVEYASSTRFYLEDQQRPETRWKTNLPFPVQVVSRVEVIDAISRGKLTTEYRYHHGHWDGAEREFRGFGRVYQRDTEVFEDFHAAGLHGADRAFEAVPIQAFSPPTETRTWFHQGPVGDEFGDWVETDFSGEFWPGDAQVLERPAAVSDFLRSLPRRARRDALRALRGIILRTELYALDGAERQDRPYTVTEALFGLREEAPPGPGEGERPRIFFPHPLSRRTTQWERGDDPMTGFRFTGDYDEYGQPRSQANIAVPRGRDFRVSAAPVEPYLATHTMTDYANRDDGQRYLIGLAAGTTSYEIVNDGSSALVTLKEAIDQGTAVRRTIGQTVNFYDGAAFQGLPSGQLGDYGALVRTESLVLTQEILHDAYRSGDTVLTPPEEPAYLSPAGAPWTAEYPQEFRNLLPSAAGHVFHAGGADSIYERGYFVVTRQQRYDFHDHQGGLGRGLLTVYRDPLGHDTSIAYDTYALLPVTVTDPASLATAATYDYRALQPREVTDPNGNRTEFTFTPLGLLESTAVRGKPGENVGDTAEDSGTRIVYGLLAFAERGQPISMRTIRRIHHANDSDIPATERDETFETVEYSDGFGRLLQMRTKAEDRTFGDPFFGDAGLPRDQALTVLGEAVGVETAPGDPTRVVVSGWQLYDNKGWTVQRYEPFFSSGWDYAPPEEAELGQKATLLYDPRGQVICTVNPDGSQQRVIHGVPANLTDPEQFTPTPWVAYTYDANDNAGRTHPAESAGYQHHWNTPASARVDPLGRVLETVERTGPDPATDWFVTRSTYDIEGNLLTVTDALGRLVFRYVYDLVRNPLRIENIDAGVHRIVLDAAGNPIEEHDSKGALILHSYDHLGRPVRLWARDGSDQLLTLREHVIYGDSPEAGLAAHEAAAANLLGRPSKQYDEAGLVTFEAYDFKGNILERLRRVIDDAVILAMFDPPPANWEVPAFRVDWQPPDASRLLDATDYRTTLSYDGLNRVKVMRYPRDVDGARRELRPRYNRAGMLERVELDGAIRVQHVAYNAKRQRILIIFGNGLMTRQVYDPETFRLTRLRTERYTAAASLTYVPTGQALQDLAYEYDLTGNITAIHDRTVGSGIPNTVLGTDALNRLFTYDPLYRLVSAEGRECDTQVPAPYWDDLPRCQDVTLTRGYTEEYAYDPVGNMTRLSHRAAPGSSTRNFEHVSGTNRLASLTVGGTVYRYAYDAVGNMIRETSSRHFEWDHSNRLRVYRTQSEGAEPSAHAHYLYDSSGQRVKRLVRKQGGQIEVTVYVDGLFEHHRVVEGRATEENNTLHVMDDRYRIALVRVGPPLMGDAGPEVQYYLGDYLGSSNLVIDDSGGWVNREEFTPHGETSFGSFARKRYRFTGKERDEESGFYYHGARYRSPWLARWVTPDPASSATKSSLYAYASGNPLRFIDSTGLADKDTVPSMMPAYGMGVDTSLDSTDPTISGSASTAPKTDLATAPTASGVSHPIALPHVEGTYPKAPVNSVNDLLTFLRNQAGFEAGKLMPPTFDPKAASPFGTKAHSLAPDVLEDMKRIWPEAKRIVSEPVIVGEKVVRFGKGPAGAPKGAHVPDILVLKKSLKTPVGSTLAEIGVKLGDLKYGGGKASPKYGRYGLPVETISGKTTSSSERIPLTGRPGTVAAPTSGLATATRALGWVGLILSIIGTAIDPFPPVTLPGTVGRGPDGRYYESNGIEWVPMDI